MKALSLLALFSLVLGTTTTAFAHDCGGKHDPTIVMCVQNSRESATPLYVVVRRDKHSKLYFDSGEYLGGRYTNFSCSMVDQSRFNDRDGSSHMTGFRTSVHTGPQDQNGHAFGRIESPDRFNRVRIANAECNFQH